jgi:hypothetical protein
MSPSLRQRSAGKTLSRSIAAARRDLGLGESAHGVAQRVDLVAEVEIHAVVGVGGHP